MTIVHHVDVSNLTEDECNKIITVISKDIAIRKSEKERTAYLNKRFEDFRREILIARQRKKKYFSFDDYCLICGKHLFTFCCFLHRGVVCIACEHYCCTSCRKVLLLKDKSNTERYYICKLCVHRRHLRLKTAEWYYEIFQKRFKRFGSAKALRAIYKQRKSIEPRVITLLALCRVIQPSRIPTGRLQTRDDDGVCYSAGSSMQKTNSIDSDILECGRRRYVSESEVENIREIRLETELENNNHKSKSESELPTDENVKLTLEEGYTLSKYEDALDEWITEGFETTGEYVPSTDSLLVTPGGEYPNSIPLITIALTDDDPIDREVCDEAKQQTRT